MDEKNMGARADALKKNAKKITGTVEVYNEMKRAANNCSSGLIEMRDGASYEGEIIHTADDQLEIRNGDKVLATVDPDAVEAITVYDSGQWIDD